MFPYCCFMSCFCNIGGIRLNFAPKRGRPLLGAKFSRIPPILQKPFYIYNNILEMRMHTYHLQEGSPGAPGEPRNKQRQLSILRSSLSGNVGTTIVFSCNFPIQASTPPFGWAEPWNCEMVTSIPSSMLMPSAFALFSPGIFPSGAVRSSAFLAAALLLDFFLPAAVGSLEST